MQCVETWTGPFLVKQYCFNLLQKCDARVSSKFAPKVVTSQRGAQSPRTRRNEKTKRRHLLVQWLQNDRDLQLDLLHTSTSESRAKADTYFYKDL